MKIKSIYLFTIALLFACTKTDTNQWHATNLNNSIAGNDTAKIPLNDLGSGTFNDSVGGLYPGGINIASGTYADDLFAASQSIIPLDTFGNPSSTVTGKVTFISMGGSTGGHNMKNLKAKTTGNPATNAKLKLISCNNGTGDASLNSIMNPNDIYWNHVAQVIKGNKSSYRQVQVLYLETEDSTRYIAFPGRPNVVKAELETSLNTFKQKFPNIKVVYVLARTQTFNVSALWNREPSPYYFGWACKWAIQDQINNVPGTEYKGNNAVAPMLAWGFYQWANTTPRTTDGFYWLSSETADGLHANAAGQDTLTNRFQKFLLTDPYASIWYAAH